MSLFDLFDGAVGAAHCAIEQLATVVPAALAVILFTLLVRLLISPLSYLQVRGERRRRALAPQIAKLQEKYRTDARKLAAETIALQRANGVGPVVGLLPGLVQAPFFLIMYRVALEAPAGYFLGVPLAAHLVAGLPAFALLLTLAGVLAWWTSRRMRALSGSPPLIRCLPYLTVLAVAWMPLAAGLYLVTSAAWTALEHLVWQRG